MRKRILLASAAAVLLAVGGLWLAIGHAPNVAQYAGQQTRDIKALSDEKIAGLRAGAGLGYAKSAELNGWPGPLHVLELRDELKLTASQEKKMQDLRQAMLEQAVPLGNELIAAEQELESVFRSQQPTADRVEEATRRVALIEARLRAVHLATHLESGPLLNGEQKKIYVSARGYGGGNHSHAGH